MKKILLALALSLSALAAHAEATFDEVQTLISQREYAAAASGLEVIIKNHPNSAKAFYAMAQAQAGLGNLEKAQLALTKATGLNPTLNFAPADSVASLKQAITPQAQKIEAIEPSHFWRNFFIVLVLGAIGLIAYDRYRNRKRPDADSGLNGIDPVTPAPTPAPDTGFKVRELSDDTRTKLYGPIPTETKFDSTSTGRFPDMATRYGGIGGSTRPTRYTPSYSSTSPTAAAAAQPTVVHHYNNSGSDMLTGVLVGSMLNQHSHAPETRVVEREVIREVPAPSSWEDVRPSYTPSVTESVRSSSWDDEPSKPSSSWSSSSSSSSWDDDSSSKSSSSSWSSSSSSSSSSWDSSSSSSSDSSSSSSSSSSWD